MAESMTPELDPRSPYYVDPDYQPNENLPMVILSQAEDNYFIWKRHFLQFLLSKSKTDFVNGAFVIPKPSSPLYEPWEVCNARVKCWMMNCVSENLKDYVRYADTAQKAWDDLRMIFVPSVDFKIYQLRQRIPTLRQDGDSLPRYFAKMRIAWMELWEYDRLPECACGGCRCEIKKRAEEAREKEERHQYKGTLDVFIKIIRQEGFSRLWRGTNASLALAVPTVGIYMPFYDYFRNVMEDFTAEKSPSLTPYVPLVAGTIARSLACISIYPVELARTRMQAFKGTQRGVKLPGVWKTLVEAVNPVKGSSSNGQNYRMLWTGLGAQLARDVPFSAICWSILEPTRRSILSFVGEEPRAGSIIGANFTAGFVAGAVAGAATCPLDVAKTRRQIEKDRDRAMKMTTRQTLAEIWRDGGMRGMFSGAGARVGRAGPSVAIVVSFYEVVKYGLHHFHQQ